MNFHGEQQPQCEASADWHLGTGTNHDNFILKMVQLNCFISAKLKLLPVSLDLHTA